MSEHGVYWCKECNRVISAYSDKQDGEWHATCGKQLEWMTAEDATPLDLSRECKMTDDVRAALCANCNCPESMHEQDSIVCATFEPQPTVTIDADLLDRVVAYIEDCQRYFDRRGQVVSEDENDLLARVKAAREGR